MNKVRVGLLPLYVKLYDEFLEYMRPRVEEFYEIIAKKLEENGLEIIRSPICRLENEFRTAIDGFERAGAEAVITLHLAYSPSLESEKPLAECKLPLIILDTTPDFSFAPTDSTALIDYNHGIHGVQDMCNLLIRNGVRYEIFTGHWENSDVCRKAADCARAFAAADSLSKSRVGKIGAPFAGMGDFRVPFEDMKRDIGIELIDCPPSVIGEYAKKVEDIRIDRQKDEDKKRFADGGVPEETYRSVTRHSPAVHDWIKDEKLDAFTINFLAAGRNTGLRHMTFDRPCRALEEGIGYAGEGDVLTAALVGSLVKYWENTTFAEMFCPNWEEGYLFLSHMGEYNIRIASKRPVMQIRPFPFGDSGDTYALMAPMKPGRAVILNLAPFGNGKYSLTAVGGEMLPTPENSNYNCVVNGWFKPDIGLEKMLKEYSLHGGTHHSALIYGVAPESLEPIAKRFGWSFRFL